MKKQDFNIKSFILGGVVAILGFIIGEIFYNLFLK